MRPNVGRFFGSGPGPELGRDQHHGRSLPPSIAAFLHQYTNTFGVLFVHTDASSRFFFPSFHPSIHPSIHPLPAVISMKAGLYNFYYQLFLFHHTVVLGSFPRPRVCLLAPRSDFTVWLLFLNVSHAVFYFYHYFCVPSANQCCQLSWSFFPLCFFF